MLTEEAAEIRYEIKLAFPGVLVAQARSWIRLHPAGLRVTYAPRRVNSLYFDSLQWECLQANLDGTNLRSKLRLRWYHDMPEDQIQNPVLEVKQKRNISGIKRRQILACTLDLRQPYLQLLQVVRAHADATWEPWLSLARQPALINRYEREYHATPDGTVRVTLDYQQTAYDQRLSPRPNLTRPLNLLDIGVIELKAPLAAAARLAEMAKHFPVPRSRNSKYTSGVLAGIS